MQKSVQAVLCMSWVLVVRCYPDHFLCWDSHVETDVDPHPHLYEAFESHHPQQMPCLKHHGSAYVFAKNRDNRNDWRIDLVHWLYWQCSLRNFFACYHLHTCSSTSYHSTRFSYYYTWNDFLLSVYIAPSLSDFPLSVPFVQTFILPYHLLEHKFLPVYDTFNSLHHYNLTWGLHFYCGFDDLDFVSRSQVCQKYKLQIVLFRFLSTVVLTLYSCYIH